MAMAKAAIFSLFGLAVAVDFNAGLPKPLSIIDTDKYETVADSREVALYQRHMRTGCSYPNSHFDCANLHDDIKAHVSTLQCLACQKGREHLTPCDQTCSYDCSQGEGCIYRDYWLINYCAKDGSSYAQVYYDDKACQVPVQFSWIPPVFQNLNSDANRDCFTGTTDLKNGTSGCSDDMDINAAGEVSQCTSGQCPTSQPVLACDLSQYCADPACDPATAGCECDFTTCAESCCDITGGGAVSIAAYETWYEVRSSSPYTPSPAFPPSYVCDEKYGQCVEVPGGRGQPQQDCESSCKKIQYLCKNNQCVEATSGYSLDDCSQICQLAIAV